MYNMYLISYIIYLFYLIYTIICMFKSKSDLKLSNHFLNILSKFESMMIKKRNWQI